MPSLLARDTTANRNKIVVCDSAGKLQIVDSGANALLTTIDSSLSGTIVTSNSAAEASLSAIETSVAGTLAVSDSTAQTTLTSIDSALAGTLTTTSGVSRTNAVLTNAAVVSASDFTSSVDANAHRSIAVYGSSSLNTQQIKVFFSDDGSNWYEDVDSNIYANGANGDYYKKLEMCARYVRFQYVSGATETTKYTLRD